MSMWADPQGYEFEAGMLLAGTHPQDDQAYPIGIKTERHAITIAGAGSGKGVAVIIPNLKLWPHNTLTIDPKGEAAEATALDREKMGFPVHVIDPFEAANIPKRFRASFNPLTQLDIKSITIKEDIEAISDGIVKRDNPEASHWDDGAQAIISGLIAFLLLKRPKAKRNLIEVRAIIRNGDAFAQAIEEMKNLAGCAGLCEAGASAAYAKEGGYFVSNAEKNTRWLDSEAMKRSLMKSTFKLSDLKRGKASVYLVLPANYLNQHGRFLRLFVRCAIEEMARRTPEGKLRDKQCLFLLDEFFSLGFIDEISKAAGLMRGYGLQLWPILQDIGQLQKLYGREGAETFFGNSDLHQFFGTMDALTLDYIAARLGNNDLSDLPLEPSPTFEARNQRFSGGGKEGAELNAMFRQWDKEENNKRKQDYGTTISRLIGRPRMAADQVAEMIKKSDGNVADAMICFVAGMRRLRLRLNPYWEMNESHVLWGVPVPILADDTATHEISPERAEYLEAEKRRMQEWEWSKFKWAVGDLVYYGFWGLLLGGIALLLIHYL